MGNDINTVNTKIVTKNDELKGLEAEKNNQQTDTAASETQMVDGGDGQMEEVQTGGGRSQDTSRIDGRIAACQIEIEKLELQRDTIRKDQSGDAGRRAAIQGDMIS